MDFVQKSKRAKMITENLSKGNENDVTGISNKRTLHVEAVGVLKVVPDICHILIRIHSQKLTVLQAKDSVERRLAYIKQAIQNCQIQDSDTKTFRSIEPGYVHTIEIFISSPDSSKLYELSEILTQKLDETVTLSPVSFSISTNALAHSRSQSASNAVQNARKKASEMARLVEGSLGSPLSIEQLGCDEGQVTSVSDDIPSSQFNSWQRACVLIKSTVRVLFELKPRKLG